MPTDIRLDEVNGTWVIVESGVLKSTASDLMLDAPGRRSTTGGHRRALVHDSGDGLTINFNRDYPGGVSVMSDLAVTGDIAVGGDLAVRGGLDLSDAALARLNHQIGVDLERIERLERSIETLAKLAGGSVVQPWRTKMEVEEGDSMGLLYPSAEALGFEVEWTWVPDHPVLGQGDVISIDPPPGSVARVGTRLQIRVVGPEF
jgi:hypothetical protein